jgi:mRNA interferase MazF
VVIVTLDPTVGSEIRKTRPCLILSPDEMNYSNVIVAPMTSKKRDYPTRIELQPDSFIVLDQIRTISIRRIVSTTDIRLSRKKINEVKRTIRQMLVD